MIDADDTLWENNIYFERAIDGFVRLLHHPTLSGAAVRAAFTEIERTRVETHGYGAMSFRDSMLAAFPLLLGREASTGAQAEVNTLAQSILHAEIELLDGVADTLPRLSACHRLILVTKGKPGEQTGKLARSGLAQHFHHVEVLHEKHRAAYQELHHRHRCDATTTWMIGNSPRSDINPALAAGLHAVVIPHRSTWVLECEPLATPQPDRHLLEMGSFRELAAVF